MRLLEYQAKKLLSNVGLRVPKSIVLDNMSTVTKVSEKIGFPVVLKVQTLIGGRGKAGGIEIIHSKQEAENWFKEKLGSKVNDHKVEAILAEELVEIEAEYYLSITLDVLTEEVILLFTTAGGIDVENTKDTNNLFTYVINTNLGIDSFKLNEIFSRAEVPYQRWGQLKEMINTLYVLFIEYECMLLEINPVVFTKANEAIIVDVHMYIDDNALYRQAEAKQIVQDWPSRYPQTWIKINHGFDFVNLNANGTVGLLSTGAGLTMALVDELHRLNIYPVNFTDVRSGQLKGDPTRLVIILEKLKKYETLEHILVSIFAGITDLAEFAALLLKAKGMVLFEREVNWVIRIEGNNYAQAKKVLESEGLFVTNSLETALDKIASV